MRNSSSEKNIPIVLFVAFCIFGGFASKAESINKTISLNPSRPQLDKVRVLTSTEIHLSNDSRATIYNFTII